MSSGDDSCPPYLFSLFQITFFHVYVHVYLSVSDSSANRKKRAVSTPMLLEEVGPESIKMLESLSESVQSDTSDTTLTEEEPAPMRRLFTISEMDRPQPKKKQM